MNKKTLRKKFNNILNELTNNDLNVNTNQIGGKKYSKKEIQQLIESALQYSMMLYMQSEQEKNILKSMLQKMRTQNIPTQNIPTQYIPTQYIPTLNIPIEVHKKTDIVIPTLDDKNNILIIMIGDMPTINDNIKHWETFINNADDTLHICIHPFTIDMRERIIKNWSSCFKKTTNFMVCNDKHWVKTGWGNISLSLATLMAIEYAMKNKPYNYYKKILFIQQCIPLYNYNVIKKECIKDDKSIFKARDGDYPGWQYSQPYNFNRDDNSGATINDWNWWNAIFGLDRKHFNIFFDDKNIDSNGLYLGTYKKHGKYTCYGDEFDNVIPIQSGKYDVLFKQVSGSWEWNKPSKIASCINSDEVFFGLGFKSNYSGNDITDNIRSINLTSLKDLYTKNLFSSLHRPTEKFIYLFDDDDKNIVKRYFNLGSSETYPILKLPEQVTTLDNDIYVYIPRIVWLLSELYIQDNYPVYIGIETDYNNKNLKEFDILRHNDEKTKNIYLRSGKEVKIDYDKKYWDPRGFQFKEIENDKSVPKQFTASNIYDQSLCYNDWTSFSCSPYNIFRGAHFTIDNDCNNNTKITEKLKEQNLVVIKFIKDNKNRIKPNKLPIWHPCEFFSITLNELINAYNIMSLCVECKKNFIDDDISVNIQTGGNYGYNDSHEKHNYTNLKKIIKFIWKRTILVFSTFVEEQFENNKSYFIYKESVSSTDKDKLARIKVGTCITKDIISSALTSGSLFIRKCVEGSGIEKFSSILQHTIVEYIPNLPKEYIDTLPNKEEFGQFIYCPESIFTWEFKRKDRNKLNEHISYKFSVEPNIVLSDDKIRIDGIEFTELKTIYDGLNTVKLYKNDRSEVILIKKSKGGDSTKKHKVIGLDGDIKAFELLKNKNLDKFFVKLHKIDDRNDIYLMEYFSGDLSALTKDYLYNSGLKIKEYIKIIRNITLTLVSLEQNGLYYSDLKLDNILFNLDNKKIDIKFGDIGSVSTTPGSFSFRQPEDKDSEKSISWALGILIISLIGGVYINHKDYKEKRKNTHIFTEYIASLIEQTEDTFKANIPISEYDSILNIIKSLLSFDVNTRLSIYDANSMIFTSYIKDTT